MAPRKTHEEYIKELAVKNPTLEVIGKYAGAKTKILHHCLIHDIYWDMQPTNALQGCGCKKCQKDKTHITRCFTTEQYSLEVKKINKNIIVLEEYINIREPILHKCLLHNVTWKAYPYLILRGCGCRQCGNEKIGNKLRKTHEEYVEEVKLIDKNIVVIGQYIDSKTPILHKCLIDSYEWYAIPTNILCNHGCPKCNESIGEKTIRKYLDNNRITYLPQYTFDDCKDKKVLPFDFYIPDLHIVIEYDGEQHYRPVEHFGGEESFATTVRHDTIKTQYCQDNNIKLLRIPYFKNIEEELNNFIHLI